MDKAYYYEYFQFEREHWWFKVRNRIIYEQILNKVNPQKEISILNIGVATGATSQILSWFGNVVSTEYDHSCCVYTLQQTKIDIIQASVKELPFKNTFFDLVCAFDVIEHVDDDAAAVKEMLRVCKHRGHVVLTVPAYMALWSPHDIVNQHYRRYSIQTLNSLLQFSREIKIIYYSYFNFFLFLPVYCFRFFSRLFTNLITRKDSGSDFSFFQNSPLLNLFCYSIFSIERKLLKYIRLPIGVSIILIASRTPS